MLYLSVSRYMRLNLSQCQNTKRYFLSFRSPLLLLVYVIYVPLGKGEFAPPELTPA